MKFKTTTFWFEVIIFCLFVMTVTLRGNLASSEVEKQEYKQDLERIKNFEKSFKEPIKDLNSLKIFGDEIQAKWSGKNKDMYAKLMLEICKPISSWRFKQEGQRGLARKYALSALLDPNNISLETELELTGHVMTPTISRIAPTGQVWVDIRKKDVEVRFHAWKRLTDAIDPNWDPNNIDFYGNVPLPPGVQGEAGMSPENIKDPNLRAKYEDAIEKNRLKSEKYLEQSRLRDWLKRFPRYAEPYIIEAYSRPPYNNEELKNYLDKYIIDDKTKMRIMDAVKKNIEEKTKNVQNSSAS